MEWRLKYLQNCLANHLQTETNWDFSVYNSVNPAFLENVVAPIPWNDKIRLSKYPVKNPNWSLEILWTWSSEICDFISFEVTNMISVSVVFLHSKNANEYEPKDANEHESKDDAYVLKPVTILHSNLPIYTCTHTLISISNWSMRHTSWGIIHSI